MRKVSIVGSGQVGSTCANLLVQKEIADVVLVDVIEGLPQGKALDIMQSAPIIDFVNQIKGTNQFEDIANSDIVVITAGSARKSGMTRADLLKINAEVVGSVAGKVVKYAPSAIIVVVTNPVDIMSYHAFKVSGLDYRRVIGVSGVLDSARFAFFLAEKLNVPIADIDALVIGAHDDTMVPLVNHSKVGTKPIASILAPDILQELVERTKKGGAEIVSYLKTGSAFYAPGAAVAYTIEMIFANGQEILPTSTLLRGQYDLNDLYLGVPCKLGEEGIIEIVELNLTSKEEEDLRKSAQAVKEGIRALGV